MGKTLIANIQENNKGKESIMTHQIPIDNAIQPDGSISSEYIKKIYQMCQHSNLPKGKHVIVDEEQIMNEQAKLMMEQPLPPDVNVDDDNDADNVLRVGPPRRPFNPNSLMEGHGFGYDDLNPVPNPLLHRGGPSSSMGGNLVGPNSALFGQIPFNGPGRGQMGPHGGRGQPRYDPMGPLSGFSNPSPNHLRRFGGPDII
eukprot:CAMPEP_0117426330 /NCGR_PEP_ID=MMETSP0758-20121206/6483_1 /TAXON_ID=63605 /ORGANISM="Percolomonas cosmopolitus, Strain AE-1 (ATCC 50343)" /LENGTH=199 /DNA_ID=CAMNT_0005211469 /DNA_START=240 /DNA_END=839 /DNA_ORIENTATION=-